MKNQLDLIERMSQLMDGIQSGAISIDKAKAMTQAADVVVQVMKTEATVYAASEGAVRPSFLKLGGELSALESDRAKRLKQLSRA
jgi:uncharacterized protein with LGFP repeats